MNKKLVMFTILGIAILDQGCGVRGDPVPPKMPAQIGRGEPTYRGATKNLAFPDVPPVYTPKAKDKKEDENDKR